MHRSLLPLLLLTYCASADPTGQAQVVLRISAGLPVLSTDDKLGAEGRFLVGRSDSPWWVGLQALGFDDMTIFVSPSETISAYHVLAGRELLPDGAFSVMPFAGLGVADWVERGALLHSSLLTSVYEKREGVSPSMVAGLDAGVSFRRHVGISLTAGAMFNHCPAAFVGVKLDAGSW